MAAGRDVLTAAAGELGNTERPAGSNRTKYGRWYGMDGVPWCMIFVQWCCDRAGLPLPYRTASCSALLGWYRKNRPEAIPETPRPGDIVIYTFGHTGILERDGGDTVTVIEGNTSPGETGSQDNGGGVYRRVRGKKLVRAYIRPGREEEKEERMDQETFGKLWKALREEMSASAAGGWSQEARAWAVEAGLVRGSGTLPDGSSDYRWGDLLTREEMAVLLYRFARLTGRPAAEQR